MTDRQHEKRDNAMIHFDTDCSAPCVGRIVNDDGADVLVQTDWDYPGVASTFGWDIESVQADDDSPCDHSGSDGTIDCGCGVSAGEFITSAGEFLQGADGATADDPGYFG